MKAIQSFQLGLEDNFQPEHIGKIVMVEHFARQKKIEHFARQNAGHQIELHTHFGRLSGFVEARGKVDREPDEKIEDLDGSEFPKFNSRIFFDDGRSVRIDERDHAKVTIYSENGL